MPKNIYLGLIKLTRLMLGNSKNVIISSGNTTVYTNTTPITGATVTYNNATYDGTTKIATNIVVTLNGITLTKDVDYIVVNNGGINAGDYTFTIEGIGEYDNYIVKTFTISKVTPTVTAPVAKSLTYSGSAQTLAYAGSTNFGTLQYSSDNSTWSTTIPTGTNAGSYTVYYRVVGNSNVNDVSSKSILCSISKIQRTISFSSAPSSLGVGNTATLSASPSAGSGDGTITYSTSNSSVASISGLTLTGVGTGTCTITATISAGTNYSSATASFTLTISNPSIDGHEYVEIGGLKWATMNIGATSVTDTGRYFQWGDTQGYTASQVGSGSGQKYFDWSDYKWTEDDGKTFTKYNGSDYTVLQSSDDAVRANWGGSWRMPTTEEFIALGEAVNSAWTSSYNNSGVPGFVLTDKNDDSKTLFFPAAGGCANGSALLIGSIGYYWASSLKTDNLSHTHSYTLNFNNSMVLWQNGYPRSFGLSIRGVAS